MRKHASIILLSLLKRVVRGRAPEENVQGRRENAVSHQFVPRGWQSTWGWKISTAGDFSYQRPVSPGHWVPPALCLMPVPKLSSSIQSANAPGWPPCAKHQLHQKAAERKGPNDKITWVLLLSLSSKLPKGRQTADKDEVRKSYG